MPVVTGGALLAAGTLSAGSSVASSLLAPKPPTPTGFGILPTYEAQQLARAGGAKALQDPTAELTARLNGILMDPKFGPQTQAETDLVNTLYSQRQAQFSNLGIGASPASQSAVAAAAAPALIQFRQNEVQNLTNAATTESNIQQQQVGNLTSVAQLGVPVTNKPAGTVLNPYQPKSGFIPPAPGTPYGPTASGFIPTA